MALLRLSATPLLHLLRAFALPLPVFSVAAPSSFRAIPDTLAALRDLLPPWLLAVPKSKTSHSKKSMRSSNKGLKEQQGTSISSHGPTDGAAIVACPSCGAPKRSHHLCSECHAAYRREFHQEAKQLEAKRKELALSTS